MALEHYAHLLEVEHIDHATVVRFKRRTILETAAVEAIGDHLLGLATSEGRRCFIVNCAGVESLTSALLGKFVALYKALEAAGGRLAFCNVDPFLLQIFKVVQMPQLIPIYPTEQEALQAV